MTDKKYTYVELLSSYTSYFVNEGYGRSYGGDGMKCTNEEWFCQLPTEEKAKVIANATYSTAEAPLTILWGGKEAEQKKWELWLKQPHHEKEEYK